MTLALSLLPILLAAVIALLYSNYLVKNWMQALHSCRTGLLKTQRAAKASIEKLRSLNQIAASLRGELKAAQIELAMAMATDNPGLAAAAQARILRIQSQRKTLDRYQRNIILDGNFQINTGLTRVISNLHQQNAENFNRAQNFFRFQILSVRGSATSLAVHPDLPDIAPIYELNKKFTGDQALSISWKSSFQTNSEKGSRWIQNQHLKNDHCTASLEPQMASFREVLLEDKP